MNPLWAMIFVLVGIILAVIQEEWKKGTFWMLLGIAVALILSHLPSL